MTDGTDHFGGNRDLLSTSTAVSDAQIGGLMELPRSAATGWLTAPNGPLDQRASERVLERREFTEQALATVKQAAHLAAL